MQQTNQTILTPSRDSSGAVLAALKAAFPQTIPVLTGYFVLGLGYGIYVQSLGLPIWLPPLMGTVVYGGSLEFVLASLLLGGGPNACAYGCLGFGSCVKACPFGAMSIQDGVAHVDHELCVGCMKCAEACPKNLIIKVPYAAQVTVPCNSQEKGAALRKYCDVGCIGCKICEKACEHDAIHVVDNLARIDYTKCTSCGQCVAKCPRHLIQDARLTAPAQSAS